MEPNANVNLTHAASFNEFVDEIRREHTGTECALLQRAIEHDLIDLLQVRQRELRRHQIGRQRGVLDLAAQALDRSLQDIAVVEAEFRFDLARVNRKPPRVGGIFLHGRNQREIGVRRGPAARIAIGAPPASQLFEIRACDVGLFHELPRCAGFKILILIDVDEAARQRPGAGKRLTFALGPLNQQDVQRVVPDRKDDDVDRRQRPRKVQLGPATDAIFLLRFHRDRPLRLRS